MEVNTRRDHRKHFRIARLFQLVLGKIILDRQDRFEINKIQNMRLESKYREMVLELEATWKITLLCTPGAGRAPGDTAPAGDSPPGLPAPLRSYFPGGFGAAGPAPSTRFASFEVMQLIFFFCLLLKLRVCPPTPAPLSHQVGDWCPPFFPPSRPFPSPGAAAT